MNMNGMEDNEDETDLFEDDDFASLSEAALQELEQNALSTQQAQAKSPSPARLNPPTSLQHPLLPATQTRLLAQGRLRSKPRHASPGFGYHPEEESFELVGDEGLPTPVDEHATYPLPLGEVSEREHFRQQRYGQSASLVVDRSLQNLPPSDLSGKSDNGLRARIAELLRERGHLAEELRAANEQVLMHKGEISIVRSNFEKESKVFDRQIVALKKSMEEESTRHTAAMNAMAEKNNNLTTRYQFLQQEHDQELQESKALKQRLKDRPHPDVETGLATTPKRGMASSLRDGFDDDDMMVVSPSKSARRSKPSTPTTANKRKRKADGPSPIKSLVLRPSSSMPSETLPLQPPGEQEAAIALVRKDKQADRGLRSLQATLEYRMKVTREPLLEALAKFALPSKPSRTFSAIVCEETARLGSQRFSGEHLQIFIDLWSKSVKEQYFKPVAPLIEIIRHVLDSDLSVVDAGIVNALTPVLQTSIAINGHKRFKHSPVYHSNLGTFRQTPQNVLNHEVDGAACLEILLIMSYIISDDATLLSQFWRLMDPEFVLMMLNVWQPISELALMLRLLATSIFPRTFGSICVGEQQEQVEHYMMNRICYLLWETPKVDEGLPANTSDQLCHLRLEVMDLLIKIVVTSSAHPHDDATHHGAQLVANDTNAIARIVRSLYDEVSAMYDLTPSHELHAELVNKGVHLLYHLLQLQGPLINLQEKLSVINGGVHKHRVVLTRLAFSEGFLIDKLISDQTVAMATSMLEESVTPDEADELIEAFPGFKGRGSTANVE